MLYINVVYVVFVKRPETPKQESEEALRDHRLACICSAHHSNSRQKWDV